MGSYHNTLLYLQYELCKYIVLNMHNAGRRSVLMMQRMPIYNINYY